MNGMVCCRYVPIYGGRLASDVVLILKNFLQVIVAMFVGDRMLL